MNGVADSGGGFPRTEALADDAWLVHLGDRIDAGTNARVHALVGRIRAASPHWQRDLVPAYTSLGVFFDAANATAASVRDWLLRQAEAALTDPLPSRAGTGRLIEVPVVYGGESGPDLASACSELGISADELVRRHSGGEYTVAMIGFAPGFPYLLGMEPGLALPRLATPRTHVPAGSVGIGGAQTGIYPRASPGGWRLIGRTPLVLFDPAQDPPSLLEPGDRVRFVPVE